MGEMEEASEEDQAFGEDDLADMDDMLGFPEDEPGEEDFVEMEDGEGVNMEGEEEVEEDEDEEMRRLMEDMDEIEVVGDGEGGYKVRKAK